MQRTRLVKLDWVLGTFKIARILIASGTIVASWEIKTGTTELRLTQTRQPKLSISWRRSYSWAHLNPLLWCLLMLSLLKASYAPQAAPTELMENWQVKDKEDVYTLPQSEIRKNVNVFCSYSTPFI